MLERLLRFVVKGSQQDSGKILQDFRQGLAIFVMKYLSKILRKILGIVDLFLKDLENTLLYRF